MYDADYWRDQAIKFRCRAEKAKDLELHAELLELAAVCEEVAEHMDVRTPGG